MINTNPRFIRTENENQGGDLALLFCGRTLTSAVQVLDVIFTYIYEDVKFRDSPLHVGKNP